MKEPLITYNNEKVLIGIPKEQPIAENEGGTFRFNNPDADKTMYDFVDLTLNEIIEYLSPFKEGQEKTYTCDDCKGSGEYRRNGKAFDGCNTCGKLIGMAGYEKGTGEITYKVTGKQELKKAHELIDELIDNFKVSKWIPILNCKQNDYIILAYVEKIKKP